MIFTVEELESYNVRQLKNIALYFSLEFSSNTSKGRLVEKIYIELEKRNNMGERIDENLPPASIRVQRIRESQKEK
jgi:hypothetical protein